MKTDIGIAIRQSVNAQLAEQTKLGTLPNEYPTAKAIERVEKVRKAPPELKWLEQMAAAKQIERETEERVANTKAEFAEYVAECVEEHKRKGY